MNVLTFVGQATVRSKVMNGDTDRAATAAGTGTRRVATRDYVRSELRSLLNELEERQREEGTTSGEPDQVSGAGSGDEGHADRR